MGKQNSARGRRTPVQLVCESLVRGQCFTAYGEWYADVRTFGRTTVVETFPQGAVQLLKPYRLSWTEWQ